MNAALQCLLHVAPLTAHFLSNRHASEVNSGNPLGYGGKIALAYAELVCDTWASAKYRYVRPTAFKRTVGQCNEQFAGFGQQDAQELLTFLLDGIHEDLNRLLKKEVCRLLLRDLISLLFLLLFVCLLLLPLYSCTFACRYSRPRRWRAHCLTRTRVQPQRHGQDT